MTTSQQQSLSLKAFLNLPPTQPESEYINGQIIQKPIPKARHVRLQTKLLQAINAVAEEAKLAYAFSQLRCTFGDRSLVPDIAVFSWERIVFDASGEPRVHTTPSVCSAFSNSDLRSPFRLASDDSPQPLTSLNASQQLPESDGEERR